MFMIVHDLFLREMLLYRGDGRHIDQFDVSKTDAGALLGPGIYLTSDPAVAHDYTAARGDEKVFPRDRADEPSFSVKDLLRNYVNRLASEFNEFAFKDEWVRRNNLGSHYSGLQSAVHRQLDYDLEQAKRKSAAQKWQEAYDSVRKDLPNLRVMKLTTGELRLIRNNRPAAISVFDVPDEYLARTLHADRPLPDEALNAFKAIWLQMYPNDNGDLRDHREKMVGFDAYVQNYQRHGTRYAWRDDGDDDWWRGGKGENPSFDDLMNGTHGGYYAFRDGMFDKDRPNSTRMINALRAMGYVGFEYDGGKRIKTSRNGAQLRGGGGKKHRAFVFWDSDEINRFRRDNAALPVNKKTNARSLPLRSV